MELDFTSPAFWRAVGQIVLIDILLGGDNAVVIALAVRKLDPSKRRQGIVWGTIGAIALRILLIVCATVVTASVISLCGQVGWVGLIVPHAARMLTGSDNRYLIPVCLLLGASAMIAIDTVARMLTASEVPVSVVTAIVGAPFFITLLRRTGGVQA